MPGHRRGQWRESAQHPKLVLFRFARRKKGVTDLEIRIWDLELRIGAQRFSFRTQTGETLNPKF
jgi:hypothetical protein